MWTSRSRHGLSAATLSIVLACLFGTPALAEPTSEDKETARTLLADGRKKLADKDFEGALKSLRAAHAIMGVPTTGLELARALEAVHLLVEAREMALSVTKIPVEAGEAKVFAKARAAASDLASDIAPRIPSLVVVVSGAAGGAEPVVTINNVLVPSAAVGLPRKVNPGKHVVEVKAPGYLAERREVELKEKDSRTVSIELKADPAGIPTTAPSVTVTPTANPVETATPQPTASVTTTVRTPPLAVTSAPRGNVPVWAWISGGVGLAAAGASIGFFVDHMGARATAQKDCPNNECDPSRYDLDSMTALRGRWNRDLGLGIGFGALSLAGLAVAIVGVARAPSDSKPRGSVSVTPYAGAANGGLRITGEF